MAGRPWRIGIRPLADQVYTWDNVARHILPGSYVGQAKDEALENYLKQLVPGAQINANKQRSVQQVIERNPSFAEIDLVITTTGEWGTEAI